MLTEREVVVAISPSGNVPELLAAVDVAVARGAAVIAITNAQSPLARKASVTLLVDHAEDPTTQMPMIGRILNLLVIDILAVGVALRRTGDAKLALEAESDEPGAGDGGARPREAPATRKAPAPGVAAATPLSKLTAHGGR